MKNNSLKIPALIIAIGLVLSLAAYLLTSVIKEPSITEHDFNYAVTYQLNGETKTLEGVYRCRFSATGVGTAPIERYYEGFYPSNPSEEHPAAYTIAQQDGLELCIETIFSDKYLMGDTEGEPAATFRYDPYLAVIDKDGVEYTDAETVGKFDAEILSWEMPQPVENTFVFSGFSKLHNDSMIAMLAVGVLVILACMIFVKRDKSVPYKGLDKLSVLCNFVIGIVVIPFITVIAGLVTLYAIGADWIYQVNYCVPAITAFSIAASLSLRRRGYTKSGFFIQFVGPVLFVLLGILETGF